MFLHICSVTFTNKLNEIKGDGVPVIYLSAHLVGSLKEKNKISYKTRNIFSFGKASHISFILFRLIQRQRQIIYFESQPHHFGIKFIRQN